ncbi:helix-turn-helix domain-containing protein [Plantibacter sp. Mn2098]|uniref:helix-turn-helix domain-containing protein n=1 Tax=Plantibacter sp. Mn2098 TaxID=3395266 RepID=UPI003BE3C51E
MNVLQDDTALGRFLTIADTADILNVSTTDVAELIDSGQLPAIRVGRGGPWRIERDVLEGYIDGQYEEARRSALWQQAQLADLPELSGGRIIRQQHPFG